LAGSTNAFVAELSWASPTLDLVYSTYLGGNANDGAQGVAIDPVSPPSGNVYVTGYTDSTNFPSEHPYQGTLGGLNDAFVAKLNWTSPTLSLVYSTYLGGSSDDQGQGIAVDSSGNAYVTGFTSSSNFPTANAYQKSLGGAGAQNAFVAELMWSAAASKLSLAYSTYLGGSGGTGITGNDGGNGIALDSSGNAYVVGWTNSTNFPTVKPYQTQMAGWSDAFVTEISSAPVAGATISTSPATSPPTLSFGSEPIGQTTAHQSATLTSSGTGTLSISKFTISGDFAFATTGTSCNYTSGGSLSSGDSCTIDVTFTPTQPGARTGSVSVSDNASDSPQSLSLTGTGTGTPKSPSKTTITGNTPNPSGGGQAVTVTFTVVAVPPATGTPTGNVTVSDGVGDTCVAKVATGKCALTPTSGGALTLTASYAGDSNFAPSVSAGVSQTVTKIGSKTTIGSHPPEPSVAGQPVTVNYTVTPIGSTNLTPTGNVTVSDGVGDSCVGSATAPNCAITIAAAGTVTLTASYAGDVNFSPSVSAGSSQTVEDFSMSATQTSRTVYPAQSTTYPVTLTAVNGLTGNVTLSCGSPLPTGVSCSASPNPQAVGATTTVTVHTTSSTPVNTYVINLVGTFGSGVPATGGLTHSIPVNLTVQGVI